ncbi:MAG: DUF1345 domain-containing protein [Verrucomicrobiota bacterium]
MTEPRHTHRSLLASISRLDAHHRFLISLGAALEYLAVAALWHLKNGAQPDPLLLLLHVILSWNIFALCLLLLAWARILTAQPKVVLHTARLQHSARKWIFLFVLAAAGASLGAVLVFLRLEKELSIEAGIWITFALSTMVLSWVLIHTIFTLQYAYLYYCRHPAGGGTALVFPEGMAEPDYYDFAYFSFIIGMTSQVSDVQIASREIRRWALLHGLVAFAFNLAVLALGFNIVSGLLGK